MAELTVANLRQLLAATVETNKATEEAGQANALRITEISSALDKVATSHQELSRSTSKVDATLERVIQANSALDRSVAELKQSMERVAAQITSMESTAPTLSTPGHADLCGSNLQPCPGQG
jgi:methyl-accepting chemotaxis protein